MSTSFEFHFQELDKIFRKFSGNEAKRKAQLIKILKEAYYLRRSDNCEPFIPASQSEWVNLFLNPDTVRKKTVREKTQVYFPKKLKVPTGTADRPIVSIVPNYSKASFKKKARILSRAQLLIFNLKKIHDAIEHYSPFEHKKNKEFTSEIFKSADASEEFLNKHNLSSNETPTLIFEKIASLENLKINDIDIKRSGKIEIPKKNLEPSGFIIRNRNSSYIPNKWIFFVQDKPYIMNSLVFQKDNGKLKILKLKADPNKITKLISVYSQYVTTETFETSDRKEYFEKYFAKNFWLYDTGHVEKPFVYKKERDMRLKFITFDKLQYSIIPEYILPMEQKYIKTNTTNEKADEIQNLFVTKDDVKKILSEKLKKINNSTLDYLKGVDVYLKLSADKIEDSNKSEAIKILTNYICLAYLWFEIEDEHAKLTGDNITELNSIAEIKNFLSKSKDYDGTTTETLSEFLAKTSLGKLTPEQIKKIIGDVAEETKIDEIVQKVLKAVDIENYYWDTVEKTVTFQFKNTIKKYTETKTEKIEIKVDKFYQKSDEAKKVINTINENIKKNIFEKIKTGGYNATVFMDYINLGTIKCEENKKDDFETKLISRFLNSFSRYMLFGVMYLFGNKMNFSNRELIRDIQAQKKFDMNVNMYIKNIKANGNFVDIISGIPAQILKIENKNIAQKVNKSKEFSANNAAAIHKEMGQLVRARVLLYERLCNSEHLKRQSIDDTMEAIKSYKLVLQSRNKFQPDLIVKETAILMKILQDIERDKREAEEYKNFKVKTQDEQKKESWWTTGKITALATAGAAGVLALSYCYFKSNVDGVLPEGANVSSALAKIEENAKNPNSNMSSATNAIALPKARKDSNQLLIGPPPSYINKRNSNQLLIGPPPSYINERNLNQLPIAPPPSYMNKRNSTQLQIAPPPGYINVTSVDSKKRSAFANESQTIFSNEDYFAAKRKVAEVGNDSELKKNPDYIKAENIIASYEKASNEGKEEKGIFSTISDNISYIVPLLGVATSYVPYLAAAATTASAAIKISSTAYNFYKSQSSEPQQPQLTKPQQSELQQQEKLVEERKEALQSEVPTQSNFKLSAEVMEKYAKFQMYFEGTADTKLIEDTELTTILSEIKNQKLAKKQKLTDVLEDVQMLEFISKYENIIKEERKKADVSPMNPRKQPSFFDNKRNTNIVMGLGAAAATVFGASELLGYTSALPWAASALAAAGGFSGIGSSIATGATALAGSAAAAPLALGAAGLAAWRYRNELASGAKAIGNAGLGAAQAVGSGIRYGAETVSNIAGGAIDYGRRALGFLNPLSYLRVDSMGNRVYNPHYQAHYNKKHRNPVNDNL